MAVTVLENFVEGMDPHARDRLKLSTFTSDLPETVTPTSVALTSVPGGVVKILTPRDVCFVIETPPDSRCPVSFSLESQSSATGALTMRWWGGDLTGMIGYLYVTYNSMKAGGISA